jgi:hypothetical protein
LLPILFLPGVNSQNTICQPFQRPQHGVEPGAAVGVEHTAQVKAEGLGDEQQRANVEGEFQPGVKVHDDGGLEFFRPDHGHDEVCAQRERKDQKDEVFHNGELLEFCAAERVEHEGGKKQDRQSDIDDVQHSPDSSRLALSRPEDAKAQTGFMWGELEGRGHRGSEARPSKCRRG